jgi:hypothetical protein
MALWNIGTPAAESSFPTKVSIPMLYAWRASSEDVVACSMGVSIFCTVVSDSPNFPRSLAAASPSAVRTRSLASAVACSCARESPVRQFTALRPITYWLPRFATEPLTTAALWVRWQISRATGGVSRVSGGCPMKRRVCTSFSSGTMFRNGDCAS